MEEKRANTLNQPFSKMINLKNTNTEDLAYIDEGKDLAFNYN